MHLVELIPTPTTAAASARPARSVRDQRRSARAWCARKDTPNFIANRVGIAGMLATMKEAEKFGLTLRRGRRPHRQEARPRQLGHLPHGRRGRPRHDGARHQDAAGQPRREERSVLRQLRDAAGARQAARSRARSARRPGRLLQEGRQATSCASTRQTGEYVAGGGKADEICRPHAEEARRPSA